MGTTSERRRTHVILPEALLQDVDARVGQRRRSEFIQGAIEEKLRRDTLLASLEEMAGSLAGISPPGWETSVSTVEWVRALRRGELMGVESPAPADSAA